MKGILWSIRRPHTDNIKSGKKTIEVRKGIPKKLTDETPNFIYETKANGGCGKVIGEFKCHRVYDIIPHDDGFGVNQYVCGWQFDEDDACLSFYELKNYLKCKHGNGLHISDLKIYDKPKELSEFFTTCKSTKNCQSWKYDCYWVENGQIECKRRLSRPPQSWCYVEK